nr:hypothetical protein [Tanacetum cinerariifolium]
MNKAVRVAVQIQTDRLSDLSEMKLKKILIEKMEGNKSIQRSDEQRNLCKALIEAYEVDKIILNTYGKTVTLKRRGDEESDKDEGPSVGSDRGSKRRREGKEPESASAPLQTATRSVGSDLEKQADSRSSFNELLDTPFDFSNFIMNRLRVDTLTPKLLAGPTYELMKGSCTSLIELEYHLEEVYKATTDQLDCVNPEGQQYPHNLLQPLPLIPDNRGHRVIPFHISSTTTLSIFGEESALDVYSKRRIIAVTDLKIVEWHSYKHLDWITVRRDDDKLYKFKEGNFKRLRLQDIEDMMLLLIQGKLSNLTVEERFAFNVSLRMFTRSIVIQRRVEDLQLGVESYQKRLNLTKLDTYQSDLKRREAYTAYSNPRGFIYQNKDKKNRLMRIDELHKFSDGTLNDVRNALDDGLKGIRMQYLPQTIWRKGDKDRAAAMIQAIDKMLKTRRIMRSLERPVSWRGSLSRIRFAAMAGISSRILNSHVEALCVIAVVSLCLPMDHYMCVSQSVVVETVNVVKMSVALFYVLFVELSLLTRQSFLVAVAAMDGVCVVVLGCGCSHRRCLSFVYRFPSDVTTTIMDYGCSHGRGQPLRHVVAAMDYVWLALFSLILTIAVSLKISLLAWNVSVGTNLSLVGISSPKNILYSLDVQSQQSTSDLSQLLQSASMRIEKGMTTSMAVVLSINIISG